MTLPGIALCAPPRVVTAGGGYDADAVTLFAAMTTPPDTTRKDVINTYIVALKSAGAWSLFDVLYVLAAADPQAAGLNWKSPSAFPLSPVGTGTYTTDRGWAGDGSSAYLDTDWDAATNGVNFAQNNNHVMAWNRTSRAANTKSLLGGYNGGSPTSIGMFTRYAGDNLYIRNSDSSGPNSNTNSSGMFLGNRTGSTAKENWRNGISMGALTDASGTPPPDDIWLGGTNYGGVLIEASTDQIAMTSLGASLAGKELAVYNAAQAYMTAVGA